MGSAESDGEKLGLREKVKVSVGVGTMERDGVALKVAVATRDSDGVSATLRVALIEPVGVGGGVSLPEYVSDCVMVKMWDTVGVSSTVGVTMCDSDSVNETADAVRDTVTDGVVDGVSVTSEEPE